MTATASNETRYFIAIPLPAEAKDRLLALQPDARPGWRIIGWNELHLTLHFVGGLPPELNEAVMQQALANVRAGAFSIRIQAVGRFPADGPAQVLWAGVQANPDLLDLHRSIGAALADAIGFRPEARPYSPHVTLARIEPAASCDGIDGYLAEHHEADLGHFAVNQFAQFSSHIKDDRPDYLERSVYRLTE